VSTADPAQTTAGRCIRLRRPGWLNAAAVVAILVIVATTALTATPATPPAIAEFAPQPFKQVKTQQGNLPSNHGTGTGVGVGGKKGKGPGVTPTPTAPPTVKPPVVTLPGSPNFHCVGDPPRQIEDPQSPPCQAPIAGDNGGATSRGVTSDSIKVFWEQELDQDPWMPIFAKFFNARFQLYGRQIQLIQSGNDGTGANEGSDEAGQRARADRAADIDKVFASTFYQGGGGYFYHDEASRKHMINVIDAETPIDSAQLRSYAPYAWAYTMDNDKLLRETGNWICARFAGGKAVHAGPVLSGSARKYAVIVRPAFDQNKIPLTALKAALNHCSVHPDVISYPTDDAPGWTTTAQKLNDGKYTTVLCLCHYTIAPRFMIAADKQGYYPEWLVTSFGMIDENWSFRFPVVPPATELDHTIGLAFRPRQLRVTDEPFWAAYRDVVGPSAQPPTDVANIWAAINAYRCMLLLASGFQMAGPRLTPTTFQSGLESKPFPNPSTSLMAGAVGFQNGTHTMTLDATEWYYDSEAPSPYAGDGGGTLCYIDGGRRRTPDQWTGVSGDPFPVPVATGRCDAAP
jgi:hypothetical protein